MRVHPSQLVPGCVLQKDVVGKTKSPIVYKETVLNETHILFLQKFLIPNVEVSAKLSDGSAFNPKPVVVEKEIRKPKVKKEKSSSLETIYFHAVNSFEKMFIEWQQHKEIDMPSIRRFILPLFERLGEFGTNIFTLHQYATKESYFYHHSVGVGLLCAYVAGKCNYQKGEMIQTGLSGLLSNCGMARISPRILRNQQVLNTTEINEIRHHPIFSYRMVEHIPTLSQSAKRSILQHHERQNGTGYPLGLSNKGLEKSASIIAVCDTYYAKTCESPHMERPSPFEVIGEIQKKQYSEFEPKVVSALVTGFLKSINGENVQLSDGQTGKIVFIDKNNLADPVVELNDNGEIISLKDQGSLSITDLVYE